MRFHQGQFLYNSHKRNKGQTTFAVCPTFSVYHKMQSLSSLCAEKALKKRAKAQKFTATKISSDKHVENAKRDFSFSSGCDIM
jgi:hypothetical protein